MSPWWFTAALGPAAYFLVASRHPGFRAQPDLTRARIADRFREEVEAAGGEGAIRGGVVVDLGFIVLFAAVAVLLLTGFDGPWWLALVPAALDLVQDLLLLIATRDTPGDGALQVLMVLTLAMYAAYVTTLVALVVALVHSF